MALFCTPCEELVPALRRLLARGPPRSAPSTPEPRPCYTDIADVPANCDLFLQLHPKALHRHRIAMRAALLYEEVDRQSNG